MRDHKIPPPHLAELRAEEDGFEGGGDFEVVGFELGDHGFDQGLVGELDAAAEGITEEFSTELAEEVIATRGEQIGAQAVETFEGGAIL